MTDADAALRPLTQDELDKIIKNHAMYSEGSVGGSRAVLTHHDLSKLNFRSADLSGADFSHSRFNQSDMEGADFSNAVFFGCDLRNANLKQAKLNRADFRGAQLIGADLRGADLNKADLRQGQVMTFTKSKSNGADKYSGKTLFIGAHMSEANLKGIRASDADFTDADLSAVLLQDADLKNAKFIGANLSDSDLSGAVLTKANLDGAIIAGTTFANNERGGLNLDNTVTDDPINSAITHSAKDLKGLLLAHVEWIESAGKAGTQLNLNGLDLRSINTLNTIPLTACSAQEAIFIGMNMRSMHLQSAHLEKSDFRDCKLDKTDMRGSHFNNSNFMRAQLKGVKACPLKVGKGQIVTDMRKCNFKYANFENADLRNVDFRESDLSFANFTGANLTGAQFSGATMTDVLSKNAQIDDDSLSFFV